MQSGMRQRLTDAAAALSAAPEASEAAAAAAAVRPVPATAADAAGEQLKSTQNASAGSGGDAKAVDGATVAAATAGPVSAQQWKVYTLEEVSKHTTRDDLWLAIRGRVYRLPSQWIMRHPGGDLPLVHLAGRDVTDPFVAFHPPAVIDKLLPSFQIGVLDHWEQTPMQKDLDDIRARLEAEGMFNTRLSYYFQKLCVQIALLGLTVLFIAKGTGLAHYLIAGCLAGAFWQQIAFLGHDIGHNSVFSSSPVLQQLGAAPGATALARVHKRMEWIAGLLVTLFFGVSVQWWKRNHNQHHFFVNHSNYDPDIQYLPVFSVSEGMLKSYFSFYHNVLFQWNRVSKLLVSWQHVLYYPVMAIARLNLNLQSVLFVFNPFNAVFNRPYEMVALTGYWMWFVFLVSFIPTWSGRFWFCTVSNALTGLIHVQITLSHFAMPTVDGSGYDSTRPDHFIESQFRGSMNVSCPRAMDWLHGGLQFQVEHHLIPRLPRHNLRHAMEQYIIPFAQRHALPYHSYSFVTANRMVLQTLRSAAYKARSLPDTEPADDAAAGAGAGAAGAPAGARVRVASFAGSFLAQLLNAEG